MATAARTGRSGRPFIYVPLRHHFEQNLHVRHRLDRYGAGRCLDYDQTGPEALAPLLAVAEREPWIPALAAALAADGRVLARLGQHEQARAALQRAAQLAAEHGLPHVLRDVREALG